MQNLPVIVAIFFAAAAIVAVLFWRIKPQPAVDVEPLNRRITEETQKVVALQAKMEAKEIALREAGVSAATAKATAEAANARADAADARTDKTKFEFIALQQKHNEVEPLVATANAQKVAAEEAKTETLHRFNDLVVRHNSLQTQFNEVKPAVAKAIAERNALEEAKIDVENRFQELSQKHDKLQAEYDKSVQSMAVSKQAAETLLVNQDKLCHEIEGLQSELTEERARRVEAVTKQQSDEASASQFKVISQEILNKTLEEAKRGMGELAASLQKTSGTELERHAEKVAETLKPLQARLLSYDESIKRMAKDSQETYGGLTQQITELQKSERSLHEQAQALTTALSTAPKLKGTYGELTLKRLIDFAGLQNHLHYKLQEAHNTEDGKKIPDLVVYLPGGQKVLVDAKAVMEACVNALQAQDEAVRKTLLDKHSNNVKSRVVDLSAKNYFYEHRDAVNAVILFLPAEHLYSTAVENDPNLIEFAMERNIIICGPNSLMMLLKVANQLWQRASIEEEAQKIKECGDAIYKAACLFIERYAKLGTKIQQLEEAYNEAAGTLNGNLIPKGRNMSRFAAVTSNKEIEDIDLLKEDIRPFSSPEAKKLLAATPRLTDLMLGDETAELSFVAGEE